MTTVRLLGSPGIDGAPLNGGAAHRHRIALLALLALTQPRGLSRDRLIAWLWPESATRPARNLLSQALHALRKLLGSNAIVSDGDEVRLNDAVITSDVAAFEAAVGAGEWECAVDRYAGDLLDGFFLDGSTGFQHWLDAERQRLRSACLLALERQAVAAADATGAVAAWQRLAVEEPYSARVALGLMQALAAAGDRAGALRCARTHTALLREEFDAEPDADVLALADRLRTESGKIPLPHTSVPALPATAEHAGVPVRTAAVVAWPRPAPSPRRSSLKSPQPAACSWLHTSLPCSETLHEP